jgi:hypothetical protein
MCASIRGSSIVREAVTKTPKGGVIEEGLRNDDRSESRPLVSFGDCCWQSFPERQ